MRAVPPDFDPSVVAAIDARLDAIEAGGVAIPLAIESGSRAWGFASPDSDYDCRFVFVRPAAAYLSLWPERDVVETPLDGLLDVGGWDLGKALRLVVKGNAVVLEWLRSPVVYRGDPEFVRQMTQFAAHYAPVDAIRRHYLHLAIQQWALWNQACAIKKAFYALRPAIVLRWMRMHPNTLPPMSLAILIEETNLDPTTQAAIDALLAVKARTRELGTAPMPRPVAALIDDEIASAKDLPMESLDLPAAREAADCLFRTIVEQAQA